MPHSSYIEKIRAQIGSSLLLLPAVTAVIREQDCFLLARQRDSGLWSLVGGGIEPMEEPGDAVLREVQEELGVAPVVHRLIGAYGGPELATRYPNGDEVCYISLAYHCTLTEPPVKLETEELLDVDWFRPSDLPTLERHLWIDKVIKDAL